MKRTTLFLPVLSLGALSLSAGILTTPVRAAGGADVSVSLSQVSASAQAYQYRVTVAGNGPETAQNVMAMLPLGKGDQAYVSHIIAPGQGGCSVGDTNISCSFDALSPSQSIVVDINVFKTATQTSKAAVSAFVKSTTPDPDKSNNTARIKIGLR